MNTRLRAIFNEIYPPPLPPLPGASLFRSISNSRIAVSQRQLTPTCQFTFRTFPPFRFHFFLFLFFFRGLLEGAFVLEMPSDNLYRLRLFCAGIEQFRRHIPVRKEAETRKKMDETVRNRPLIRFIMRVRTGISHPVRRIQQV